MGRRTLLLIASILVAAVGTGLIALYVRDANDRASEGIVQRRVVVTVKPITQGETLTQAINDSAFDLLSVPQKSLPKQGYLEGESGLDQLRARGTDIALFAMPSNTTVISTSFSGATDATSGAVTKDQVAIQIQLSDPFRGAGVIKPGGKVAVIVTGKDIGKKNSVPQSKYLMTDIQVIRVGSTGVGAITADTTGTVANQILTLSVSPREALSLRFAEGNGGDLSLVLQGNTSIAPSSIPAVNNFDVVG